MCFIQNEKFFSTLFEHSNVEFLHLIMLVDDNSIILITFNWIFRVETKNNQSTKQICLVYEIIIKIV